MFEQAFKNIDDALWKEAGCTTELDYTEQTSWLLFLKYLDALEHQKAMEAGLEGRKYSYVLDPPYRFVVEKSELIRTLLTQMFEHHLKPGGYVVFRHESRGNLMFADAEEFDLREYGGMKLRFLRARST